MEKIKPGPMDQEMTITIRRIDKAHKKALEEFFYQLQFLGNVGGSRWVDFFADGDGNFSPEIAVDGVKPKHQDKNVWSEEKREYRIDFEIYYNWLDDEIKVGNL